jgi:hypothetical protein
MKWYLFLILLTICQIATAQMPKYKYEGYEQDIVFMQERMPHPTIPNYTLFTPRATAAANRFFHAFNFVGMKFGTVAEMMGDNIRNLDRKENEGLYYTIPSPSGTSGAQYFGFIVKGGIIMAIDFGVTP